MYSRNKIVNRVFFFLLVLLLIVQTNAFIKLEPIENETIKLSSDKNYDFEIIIEDKNYQIGEEIFGWINFRINDIPVASKDTTIEIIKDQRTIQTIRTSKTTFKTEIQEPGFYTIKAETIYNNEVATSIQRLIINEKPIEEIKEIEIFETINETIIDIQIDKIKKITLDNKTANIIGNITIKDYAKNIYPLPIDIFIYKENSNLITHCPLTINENLTNFECQLKGQIELGKYIIETQSNLKTKNDIFSKQKSFDISIKQSKNLNITTNIISENKTSSEIIIPININKEQVSVSIKNIAPDNKTLINQYQLNNFIYSFVPKTTGNYKIEIEVYSNKEYSKKVLEINVTKDEKEFKIIPLENKDFYLTGELSFEVFLPKIKRNNQTNLTINIKSLEDNHEFGCTYSIEPHETNFTINCPSKNYLTLGNYEITGKINKIETKTFARLTIDEANLTIINQNIYQNRINKLNLELKDKDFNLEKTKIFGNIKSKNDEIIEQLNFEKIQDNLFSTDIFLSKEIYLIQLTIKDNKTTKIKEFTINPIQDEKDIKQGSARIDEDVIWTIQNYGQEIKIPLSAKEIKQLNNKGEIINTKLTTKIQNLTIEQLKELINETLNIKDELENEIRNRNLIIRLRDNIRNNKQKERLNELNLIVDKLEINVSNKDEIIATKTPIEKSEETSIIEYKTPGPTKKEKIITENKKQIIVESPIHYQNITTTTKIQETQKENIKLFWYINGTKTDVTNDKKVNPRFIDTNNNGFVDEIIWTTPHTSTQIFEIEIIIPQDLKIIDTKIIEDKLWLVQLNINSTNDYLTLEHKRGLFASDIQCTTIDNYKINQTEIDNVYQENQTTEIQYNLSKYNKNINSTQLINCQDITIVYTIQIPRIFNKSQTIIEYKQQKEIVYPNTNTNLIILPEYNIEHLEDTNISKVNITIKTELNKTPVKADVLEIILHTINNKTIIREITDITTDYIFTLDKTSNLYNKIEIIAEYNNTKNIKTILIKPNITNDFNYNENIEFFIDNILSAKVLYSNDEETNFSIEITPNKVTLTPIKNSLKPGLYQLIITHEDYTETIWFKFGLIAFNTHKPIYHSNETAKIEFVVLDNRGYIVNDAFIEFEITRPDGFKQIFTTDNFIKVNNKGIYHLNYYLEDIGKYTLHAKATTYDGTTQLTRHIHAVENYDFDILRESKITIDPNLENITTVFTFNSYLEETPDTFKFTEKIPLNFEIAEANGAKITTDNEFKYLTWEDVKITDKLNYTAKTPIKTPYLYQLGRSEIEYGGLFNKQTYIENQTKFLAIDPVAQGNAFIMWGWGDDSVRQVRYRTYNPRTNSFGSTQTDVPFANLANNNPYWVETKQHPFKTEVAVAWLTARQDAYAAIWNGTDWGNLIQLTTNTGTSYKAIDLAYEQNSGDLLVFYGDNTNIPKYRIWNGTGWSAQNSANNIGSTPRFIRAEAKPNINSNEIMLVTSDAASDINTQVWDGTSFSGVTELTATSFNDRHSFDVAYETFSNDAMVTYRIFTATELGEQDNLEED